MGGIFSLKKDFQGGTNIFGLIYGGIVLHGSHYHIMQGGRKSFTDAFSSNLNSVHLKIFPTHGGRHT